MPLPDKLFDTAFSDEIKQYIKAAVVANVLKDINYLEQHIQDTLSANPSAIHFLFTVWYQSEWVVIEYNKTSNRYTAYTQLQLPNKKITYHYRQLSDHILHEVLKDIFIIYENLKKIDLDKHIKASLDCLDFSTKSFKNFYILTDALNKQYFLYEAMPGRWLNLVIEGNQVLIYGKIEDLQSCNIESAKKNIQYLLANPDLSYQIQEQSSSIPSFLNALNNLVQIQEKIEPTPVVHYKLIEAFAELVVVRLPKKEASSIDWEELFAKLEGIGIIFDEDKNKFIFNGQDKPHVSLIDIEVDESQQDYEPPIFIYYENKNEKFILAKQQTYDKYAHLISGDQVQNVKWIKHDNALNIYEYCYQVLNQIKQGKDIKLLDFICDDTASINSSIDYVSKNDEGLYFFKPHPLPKNPDSKSWMSRDTLINSVLFGLGAASLVVFGLTMAGPALLIGLLLFAILAVRVIKPNPTMISPS
jgi:hypothetical protein